MKIVSDVNAVLYILLTLFYFYQGVYVLIALIGKKKKNNIKEDNAALHKYAFIIAARNENAVIGNLIDSIKNQNYPKELIDVIVVADNCTDNTAEISRQHGAIVYERFNNILVISCWLMCKDRTINTDSFYKTLCDNAFIFHID